MMSKLREIFSEKLRLSGIRGCMAAGAMTAGIAALAVIGGVNSEDISTVSLETDVIPEETVAEAAVEKKTYAHDMEYFSSEDMKKMTSEEEEEDPITEEINAAAAPENKAVSEAEENAAAQTEAEAEEPASEPEEEISEEPSAAHADEDTVSYEEEPSEEEPADIEAVSEDTSDNSGSEQSEEDEEEKTASIVALDSAAGGDEDESGLSSALDIESESDSENTDEADEFIIVYSEAETEADNSADTYSEEEDINAVPEDITLEDENVTETETETETEETAPQKGAISQFDLPEWLEFDENGVPTEYVQVLTGNACAYTADPDALMSTGKEVFQGYVAVDPDIIPYGTELYIVAEDGEVYGYAIAADTGYSVRKGHIIVDLFMNEYDDCIQWGNKPVYVYVLK